MQNLNSDKPIENAKEDLLGMDPFAKHVGNVIKYNCFSNTDSFVFALYAKWGKGKTSFINLLKPYLIKLGNNNQNKKSKNICIFDLLLNGIVKLHIILFVWLFSFEEFLLKYDLFKNILISTCNIDYNVYLLAIVSLVLKIILSFLIAAKIPNIKLDYIICRNKCCKSKVVDEIYIIDFSPWNMVDEETLIKNFFVRIQKAISQTSKNTELDKYVTKYMNAIFQKCSNGLINFDIFKEKDIAATKEEIIKDLKNANTKIIVFIDDIDRLDDNEICLIFKLVKSIANLPNISYFLSFDKDIVSNALNERHKGNGENYLEKLIQVPISLPQIKGYNLENYIQKEIGKFVAENKEIEKDWEYRYKNSWESIFYFKLFYALEDIRDVKRYINFLKMNYNDAIKNEVNIIDFFLLSILKLKCSVLCDFIHKNKSFFIQGSILVNNADNTKEIEKYKKELDKIFEPYNLNEKEHLIKILYFLFPSTRKLYENVFVARGESRKGCSIDGRICSSENFNKFFWLGCDENDISLSEMDEYIDLTKDVNLFSEKLIKLNNQKKLRIFLAKFEDYIEHNIAIENTPNIIKAFFNKGDYFDYSYEGFYSTNIATYIFRIVFELLKKKEINNPIEILEEAINDNESIFPATQFIGYLVESLNNNNQYDFQNLNKEDLQPIVDKLLYQIYELANNDMENIDDKTKVFNGHIINNPMIRNILWFWYKNGDIEQLKSYVQAMTNTNEKLFIFLDLVSSTSYISDSNGSREEKRLRKDDLEIYFNIDNLREKLESIEPTSLSAKEQEIKERVICGLNNQNYRN